MKPISYFEFQRKRFMKILRSKFEIYPIKCKVFKTGNLKQFEIIDKEMLECINKTLQNKIVFDNNNIFLILQNLDDYDQFIFDFSDSIKNTENIESLKDRHIALFKRQIELNEFFKNNLLNPQPVTLPT